MEEKIQKVIIVSLIDQNNSERQNGLNEINQMLEDGWKVISTSPMGAYGYGYGGGMFYDEVGNDYSVENHGTGFASLVILEK